MYEANQEIEVQHPGYETTSKALVTRVGEISDGWRMIYVRSDHAPEPANLAELQASSFFPVATDLTHPRTECHRPDCVAGTRIHGTCNTCGENRLKPNDNEKGQTGGIGC